MYVKDLKKKFLVIKNGGISRWTLTLNIAFVVNTKESVCKSIGSDLVPSLWCPPSWIADYCSRDGAVCPVSRTVICSVCTVLQKSVLGTGPTAPSLEQ